MGLILGKQLLRSATSVGAQYREARRARSRAEFSSKIDCVIQELDESSYWFDLIHEAKILPNEIIKPLHHEAQELISIFVASSKTAKKKQFTLAHTSFPIFYRS